MPLESRPHSPTSRAEASRHPETPRLIVSRHSLIGQIGSSDRSEELLLPPRLARGHDELAPPRFPEPHNQTSTAYQGPSQDRNFYPTQSDASHVWGCNPIEQTNAASSDFFHMFSPWQFDDYGWSPDTWESTQWMNNFST